MKVARKVARRIRIAVIIATVFLAVFLLLQNLGYCGFFRDFFNLIGRDQLKLLRKLNSEWSLPDDYTLERIEADGLMMEWVEAKITSSDEAVIDEAVISSEAAVPKRAILQLHGGGYVMSLDSNGATYRRTAVKYAQISGAGVLTVDYRVAPMHPYPAALEDALSAYNWLLDKGYKPSDIIVAGDSAGGGLALALGLYLRDHGKPLPAAIITMSAWTNLYFPVIKMPYVGDNDPKDPYISPIYGDYTGFPPLLMQVGGEEILLSDTLKVAEKAENAGVSVKQSTYKGMFHVFQMLFPELPDANVAWYEVQEFIAGIWEQ